MAELKRLNDERKLEHTSFSLKLGTTNKLNPIVIYVEAKTFITPMVEKDSYNKDINEIKRQLKNGIRDKIISSNHFLNEYILDFQIANNGIRCEKKSNLTFEVLLKQPKNNILKINEIKDKIEQNINTMLDDLQNSIIEHNFSINKYKKVAE